MNFNELRKFKDLIILSNFFNAFLNAVLSCLVLVLFSTEIYSRNTCILLGLTVLFFFMASSLLSAYYYSINSNKNFFDSFIISKIETNIYYVLFTIQTIIFATFASVSLFVLIMIFSITYFLFLKTIKKFPADIIFKSFFKISPIIFGLFFYSDASDKIFILILFYALNIFWELFLLLQKNNYQYLKYFFGTGLFIGVIILIQWNKGIYNPSLRLFFIPLLILFLILAIFLAIRRINFTLCKSSAFNSIINFILQLIALFAFYRGTI